MNIKLDFYFDNEEARITGVNFSCGIGVADTGLYKDVMNLTQIVTESYLSALQDLIKAYNKPTVEPTVEPTPTIDPHLGEDPIPVPIVTPPVETMSAKAEVISEGEALPTEEAKPLTMEDVRKVLIEVKKTKGVKGLKRCFSVVGADKLPNVDPSEYGALYSAAKGELDA